MITLLPMFTKILRDGRTIQFKVSCQCSTLTFLDTRQFWLVSEINHDSTRPDKALVQNKESSAIEGCFLDDNLLKKLEILFILLVTLPQAPTLLTNMAARK